MSQPKVTFVQFMRLVLDALEAAKVPYMIGGAVCLWAWGAIRTTQDFDVAINLPLEQVIPLSEELKKRDMLVPYDIIFDLMIQATLLPDQRAA